MKMRLIIKIISMLLVLATLLSALPMNVLAETVKGDTSELYVKSIKLVQAKTKEEAKRSLLGLVFGRIKQ